MDIHAKIHAELLKEDCSEDKLDSTFLVAILIYTKSECEGTKEDLQEGKSMILCNRNGRPCKKPKKIGQQLPSCVQSQ